MLIFINCLCKKYIKNEKQESYIIRIAYDIIGRVNQKGKITKQKVKEKLQERQQRSIQGQVQKQRQVVAKKSGCTFFSTYPRKTIDMIIPQEITTPDNQDLKKPSLSSASSTTQLQKSNQKVSVNNMDLQSSAKYIGIKWADPSKETAVVGFFNEQDAQKAANEMNNMKFEDMQVVTELCASDRNQQRSPQQKSWSSRNNYRNRRSNYNN